MPNAEETRCYQPFKNIKIHCGIESSVMKKKCRDDAVSKKERKKHPGNFAMIAKISLGLRNFRWDCENFAILAKLGNFARENHCAPKSNSALSMQVPPMLTDIVGDPGSLYFIGSCSE